MGDITSKRTNGKVAKKNEDGGPIFVKRELRCSWCGYGTRQVAITKDGKVVPCCGDCVPEGAKFSWLARLETVQIVNRDDYSSDENDVKEEYLPDVEEDDDIDDDDAPGYGIPEDDEDADEGEPEEECEAEKMVRMLLGQDVEQEPTAAEIKEEQQRKRKGRVQRVAQKIQSNPAFKEETKDDED